MTKKEKQRLINRVATKELEKALSERVYTTKRLRTCSAYAMETDNYHILQSYNTIVAVINKRKNLCFDVLRTEYGYTATSAKHIAKFKQDVGTCYPIKTYTAR